MDFGSALGLGLGGGLAALAFGLVFGVVRWVWIAGRRAVGGPRPGTDRPLGKRPKVEPPVEGRRVYGDEPPLSGRG